MNVGEALDLRTHDDVVVACLRGDIDLSNARAIGSLVSGAVPNDAAGLVLDLSATTYLDSSGVHLIFDLLERVGARQQRLALAVPPDSRIMRVLDLVNARSVVPLVDEVDTAIERVRDGGGAGG